MRMKGNMSRREFSKRLGMIVGGLAVAVIGVPLLILPGSGMILILLGAGLVGEGLGVDVKGWLKHVVLRFSRKDADRVGRMPSPAGGDYDARAPRRVSRSTGPRENASEKG